MKRFAVVALLLLMPFLGMAQASVQTLVPAQSISIGQSFQVQYVVSDLQQFEGLQTPDFGPDFKQVSGPTMYNATIIKGGKTVPVHNYSFTLVPLRKGRLSITGATAVYTHKKEVAAGAVINCVAAPAKAKQAVLAQAFPFEEQEERVPPLLLVQAAVDKKECYVGEPIVATFTLISNVVAGAEVVKNPGFYGFSVVEMPKGRIRLTENDIAAGYEKHLLRKVQLYPMQAGKLVIDEMTVYNVAEWPDAATGRTKEKEIFLNSTPISIVVKPLPPSNLDTFTGAVGNFALQARLQQKSLKRGQTGKLEVTLSGAGNFLQLPIPEVPWPQGVEGFEPRVAEDLQKEVVPEKGKKQYEFSFTTDSAGNYTIPPLTFTYFNPQTKKYITTATDSLHFTVEGQKGSKTFFSKTKQEEEAPAFNWWMVVPVALLGLVAVVVVFRKRGTAKKGVPQKEARPLAEQLSFTERVQRLHWDQKDLKTFYGQLQQLVYLFLKEKYGISGNNMQHQIETASFTAEQKRDLHMIIEECESVQYYNATPSLSFHALQTKAVQTINSLERGK